VSRPRPATAIVLFTDLVGSTALRESLGDDRADELRRHHDRLLREAIAAHDGSEVKGTGDGLMVVFDAAAAAVSAAVAMQRSVRRAGRSLGVPIDIRIGISAGDVLWENDDCFGRPVVEARRLCDAARGGSILAADVVRVLAGSRVEHTFVAVGEIELKGLTGAVAATEVDWAQHVEGGLLPAPLAGAEGVAFVGRAVELEGLVAAWKEAVAGGRRSVLLSGEPGIGKTRLAFELARTAAGQGATVLYGRCDEDAAVPYQPFAEAVRGHVALVGAETVAAHAGDSLADFARLVPGALTVPVSTQRSQTADADTERFLLFESVVGWLASVAAESPLVIVLDDLHWAGKPTLLLLRHLLRGDVLHGLLFLGTYRDTDLGRNHPLADVLVELRRDPAVERMSLGGLGPEEVTELVAVTAGHELDADGLDLARVVHAETEGNPFFVDQILRHLAESGAVVRRHGRWERGAAADTTGIPEGVREVIGRRLARLSDESNAVLEAAAVLGRDFNLDLVAATADVDTESVLDAIEAAEVARLVAAAPGEALRWSFAHALVRSTVYEEIATTRRLRLHRRAARALEPQAEEDPDLLADLAHHYCEAAALGEADRAVEYSRRAAGHAAHGLAYEEAAELLARALDVLEPNRPEERRRRAELLLEIGDFRWCAGERVGADGANWEVVELARALGDVELLARAAVALSGRRGWREAGVLEPAVVAVLEEAAAALPTDDSPLRAIVLSRLSGVLYFDPATYDRRFALTSESIAMARRMGDPQTLLAVLTAGFGALSEGDGLHVSRARAEEVLELARQLGSLEDELSGLSLGLQSAVQGGRLDEADRFAEAEADLAGRLRQPDYMSAARVHASAVALARGRIGEAERLAAEGLAIGQAAGIGTALQMFGVFEIARRRLVGGLEEMAILSRAMVEEYPLVPAWRTGLAYILAELDNRQGTGEQLEVLVSDGAVQLPRDANWPVGIALCAYSAALIGDRARCVTVAADIAELDGWCIQVGMPADALGAAEVFHGMAAFVAGERDEGTRLLRVGIERNQSIGMPLWAASGQWALGRLLGEAGRVDEATVLLSHAREGFAAHEAQRMVTRAEQDLRRLET
jgi:class 3 adenylate cyclase/tetratricopeptide (TPR) repeat protein